MAEQLANKMKLGIKKEKEKVKGLNEANEKLAKEKGQL